MSWIRHDLTSHLTGQVAGRLDSWMSAVCVSRFDILPTSWAQIPSDFAATGLDRNLKRRVILCKKIFCSYLTRMSDLKLEMAVKANFCMLFLLHWLENLSDWLQIMGQYSSVSSWFYERKIGTNSSKLHSLNAFVPRNVPVPWTVTTL